MNIKNKYENNNFIEILLFLSAVIAPGFVFIWLKLNPEMPVHLKWSSWIVTLSFTFLYFLKYISSFVRRHLGYFFYLLCYIDKSFISSIADSANAAALVKTIIDIGKSLKFNIIAEGIEEIEQAYFLKENNCDIGQGYLYSKPIEAVAFEKLFKNWKNN